MPNEPLPTGKTDLMLAARNGNPDALKALIDGGANVNAKEKLRGHVYVALDSYVLLVLRPLVSGLSL